MCAFCRYLFFTPCLKHTFHRPTPVGLMGCFSQKMFMHRASDGVCTWESSVCALLGGGRGSASKIDERVVGKSRCDVGHIHHPRSCGAAEQRKRKQRKGNRIADKLITSGGEKHREGFVTLITSFSNPET